MWPLLACTEHAQRLLLACHLSTYTNMRLLLTYYLMDSSLESAELKLKKKFFKLIFLFFFFQIFWKHR